MPSVFTLYGQLDSMGRREIKGKYIKESVRFPPPAVGPAGSQGPAHAPWPCRGRLSLSLCLCTPSLSLTMFPPVLTRPPYLSPQPPLLKSLPGTSWLVCKTREAVKNCIATVPNLINHKRH